MSNYTPIKCIGTVVTGKTPSTNIAENFGDEYMFVTPTELHDKFIIEKSDKMLTQKGLDSIKSNAIQGLSILVGCIGWDMGNVALVNEKCATNQQINSITKIKEAYNPYYIYYWLFTQKENLFKRATITRTPILNKTTFEEILVPTPDKSIQDGIANLLLPISKKIQLNNSIITELEKVAKTLYNYWFVQFDFPNAKGKPYRISGGKMEHNKILRREIPKGWKVDKLKNVTEIALGGTPDTQNKVYWGDQFYWLNSGEVTNFPVITSELKVTQKGIDNSATKLLPYGTTILSITGNIRASILGIQSCANQSVVGVYENESLKCSYFYPLLYNMLQTYAAVSTGNCQTHINKGTIEDTTIVIPPEAIMKKYNSFCSSIYRKIINTALESRQNTELRDFLLPLLMNGQVIVKSCKKTHNRACETRSRTDE
jgi:type I restriction enzyme S subunit